jgi:hemerythrin-like metal-binding protein
MTLRGLSNLLWPERERQRGRCPEWHSSLLTGHPTIDAEHQSLIDLLAASYRALSDPGLPAAEVRETVEALDAFARNHFAYEEGLMSHEGMDPGHRERHLAAHRSFLGVISGLLEGVDGMPSDVCGEMMEFLSSWLGNHIRVTDVELAALCNALGISDAGPDALVAQ